LIGNTISIAPSGNNVGVFSSTGLAVTGTGTFNVSATNPVVISRASDATGYGILSFNNVFTAGGMLGPAGGGGIDSTLYLNSPTGGSVVSRVNAVAISTVSSTGLAVTGTLSCTTGANFATSSGDCGIGTSSPTSSNGNVGKILQVAAAGNTSSSIIASTAGVSVDNAGIFEVRATAQTSGSDRIGQIYIGRENTSTTALSGYMGFSTPSSGTFAERMRLDSSGNVGIGVTPSTWNAFNPLLQIGNISIGGTGTTNARFMNNIYYNSGWKYYGNGTGTHYEMDGYHAWSTVASGTAGNAATLVERARIDTSGNFLLGKTDTSFSSNGFAFINGGAFETVGTANRMSLKRTNDGNIVEFYQSVNVGTISITSSATSYNTSSDYRRKSNVKDLTGSGAFIDALKPRTFDWDSGDKGVGFIAHEFAEVSPSSVTGEKDAVDADGNPKYQAMQASSAEVIANLVAELQSLRQRVAALETR
jgi:hypothetical protein